MMSKLQEYFMKNKKEAPDVIETTSGEKLTPVKKNTKVKDAVPDTHISTTPRFSRGTFPPHPYPALKTGGDPFIESYLPDDPIIKKIKSIVTVEEWEILKNTTFRSPQEQILRYADIITRLAMDDNIFDKKSDMDKEKSE